MNGKLNVIHNMYCSISSFHFCAKSNIMLRFHKPKVKMEARVKNSKNIDSSRKIAPLTDKSYEQQLPIWNLRPCKSLFTRFDFLFLHILVTLMEANLSTKMQMCPTAIHMI